HHLDGAFRAQDLVRERRGERPDAMSAQSIQRAQLGAAPDHELLREVEIRAGEQYAAAQRRRVLQPVDDDVEIAALERGHEVGPVVLEKALTHAELRRERAHQVDLEADQLVRVAGIAKDVRLAALQVSPPADLAVRTHPREAGSREEQGQRQGADRHRRKLPRPRTPWWHWTMGWRL